ncbi:hypothetical protein E8E12_001101 [Didymella heteroderae]|uniref:Uncharacterized protein n=1 Tax=Didymella heteroderae TaxID=1769908 RepID=A0A9P4WFX1_9PLEO|nr:hypothetical protein E8E12_001101 [Didymella heteroderae]
MQFFTLQDHDEYSLRQKLLIGHQDGTGYGIYAQWRKHGETQRIDLFVLVDTNKINLNIADLPQHRILHPFDKAYPWGSMQLDGSDRSRITALVRWYFIAAGFVRGCAIQRDYGKLLKKVLLYVKERNYSNATRPEAVSWESSREPSTAEEDLSLTASILSTDSSPSKHVAKSAVTAGAIFAGPGSQEVPIEVDDQYTGANTVAGEDMANERNATGQWGLMGFQPSRSKQIDLEQDLRQKTTARISTPSTLSLPSSADMTTTSEHDKIATGTGPRPPDQPSKGIWRLPVASKAGTPSIGDSLPVIPACQPDALKKGEKRTIGSDDLSSDKRRCQEELRLAHHIAIEDRYASLSDSTTDILPGAQTEQTPQRRSNIAGTPIVSSERVPMERNEISLSKTAPHSSLGTVTAAEPISAVPGMMTETLQIPEDLSIAHGPGTCSPQGKEGFREPIGPRMSRGYASRTAPVNIIPSDAAQPVRRGNKDHTGDTGGTRAQGRGEVVAAKSELTPLLIAYLDPKLDMPCDENRLFECLQLVWKIRENQLKRDLPKVDYYREALDIWIRERKSRAVLRSIEGCSSSARLIPHSILHEDTLETLRLQWEDLRERNSLQLLSVDDVVCGTFTLLMRTKNNRTEERRQWFRGALQELRGTQSTDSQSRDLANLEGHVVV